MRPPGRPAFSLVELLVALVIAAGVLATAVIVFNSLITAPRGSIYPAQVTLGSETLSTLFGMNSSTIEVPTAPSYGSRVQADLLRDEFWSDVRHATAVFCLGRNGRNTYHELEIPMPASVDGRSIDSPNAFLTFLEANDDTETAAGVFTPYVNNVSTATNGSIFILQRNPSEDQSERLVLTVRAIYDIDVIPTVGGTEPAGTYVSVQRYAKDSDGNMSRTSKYGAGYFHVLYPSLDYPDHSDVPGTFSPLFVFFPRAALKSVVEGTAIDRFKVAKDRPFYFIWWPDPTMPTLATTSTTTYPSSNPLAAYGDMGGRTSYFFAVPMMPPL